MAGRAQLPDQVLGWLHNSLTREYQDVGFTYVDVARTLETFPSLSPRTEVYTYENGAHALLLLLQGTLPVIFRGTTYRFPLSIWVPHAYPKEAPNVFVTASQDLAVRPGTHVSAEGRIYHPYLASWPSNGNRSNLIECLAILQDVFAKEPPVVARASVQQQSANGQIGAVPGPPSRSSLSRPGVAAPPSSNQGPAAPPPPPKPPELANTPPAAPSQVSTEAQRRGEAPPLPPKPNDTAYTGTSSPQHRVSTQHPPVQQDTISSYNLPYGRHLSTGPSPQRYQHAPQNAPIPHVPAGQPAMGYASPPHAQQPLPPQQGFSMQRQNYPSQQFSPSNIHGISMPPQMPPAQAVQTKKPPPDLMSNPLDSILPPQQSPNPNIPAPPIPPNPEKDALLQAISSALRAQLEEAVNRNKTALPALETQQAALRQAQYAMQTEMRQLEELDATLTSNEKVLRESTREIDRMMESVGQRELPPVDDVLVAPTVVSEQLYKLVADERSLGDVMFALTRALDKGRVAPDVFIKQTRSLAREQFLQRALIKKIGRGIGLNMDHV